MGLVKSLQIIMCLVIFYIFMSFLNIGGVQVFGSGFYTELGFIAFVSAVFLDASFALLK